jgi:hypothetical protein
MVPVGDVGSDDLRLKLFGSALIDATGVENLFSLHIGVGKSPPPLVLGDITDLLRPGPNIASKRIGHDSSATFALLFLTALLLPSLPVLKLDIPERCVCN